MRYTINLRSFKHCKVDTSLCLGSAHKAHQNKQWEKNLNQQEKEHGRHRWGETNTMTDLRKEIDKGDGWETGNLFTDKFF